jgi:predicted enzyme related to lactoylglutathione lyase
MDRTTILGSHGHVTVRAAVPGARTVPSLDGALRLVRSGGGWVTSETRTVPGIGSWALVTDRHGNELVLWEDAQAIGY